MKDDEKYQRFLLKDYKYWRLYLHENQSGLGRVYLWAKREEATNLLEITDEELLEFKRAAQEVGIALQKSFEADWLNFEFLGNETAHLHCHIIPRYKSSRIFEDLIFEDKTWGAPFDHRLKREFTEEFIMKVKEKITSNLD